MLTLIFSSIANLSLFYLDPGEALPIRSEYIDQNFPLPRVRIRVCLCVVRACLGALIANIVPF